MKVIGPILIFLGLCAVAFSYYWTSTSEIRYWNKACYEWHYVDYRFDEPKTAYGTYGWTLQKSIGITKNAIEEKKAKLEQDPDYTDLGRTLAGLEAELEDLENQFLQEQETAYNECIHDVRKALLTK